jgi:hypothetical protein
VRRPLTVDSLASGSGLLGLPQPRDRQIPPNWETVGR